MQNHPSMADEQPANFQMNQIELINENDRKFCLNIISKLKKNNNAIPFLKPVDPIALNIPDYPEKIKHPMDISTIKNKLDTKQYKNMEEFNEDVILMFNNCYTYNHPESPVYMMAKDLHNAYEALYEGRKDVPVKRTTTESSPIKIKRTARPIENMSPEDFQYCQDILSELEKSKHKKYSWPFLYPVTEQDAPGYFSVITNPVDLSTIRIRLDTKKYGSSQEFISDLELMIDNCFKYNLPESEVHNCGVEFKKLIDSLTTNTNGKAPKDVEGRINELRKKISALTQELCTLEQQSSKVVYSLSDREKIGRFILQMNKTQIEGVAKIVHRHCAYEYVNNDEIEINLHTMRDDVVGEIDQYILKIKNGEGDDLLSGSDD